MLAEAELAAVETSAPDDAEVHVPMVAGEEAGAQSEDSWSLQSLLFYRDGGHVAGDDANSDAEQQEGMVVSFRRSVGAEDAYMEHIRSLRTNGARVGLSVHEFSELQAREKSSAGGPTALTREMGLDDDGGDAGAALSQQRAMQRSRLMGAPQEIEHIIPREELFAALADCNRNITRLGRSQRQLAFTAAALHVFLLVFLFPRYGTGLGITSWMLLGGFVWYLAIVLFLELRYAHANRAKLRFSLGGPAHRLQRARLAATLGRLAERYPGLSFEHYSDWIQLATVGTELVVVRLRASAPAPSLSLSSPVT